MKLKNNTGPYGAFASKRQLNLNRYKMKFENLYINEALTNGLIDVLKQSPDLIGFAFAALDHKFTVKLPGCMVCTYGKISISVHTQGQTHDRMVWITKSGENEIIKKFIAEKFDWSAVQILNGRLYYNHIFICTTTVK